MRLLLALATLALLAGCVQPAEPVESASTEAPIAADALPDVAPTLVEWKGHIVASEIEGPTHVQPTEQVMWPLMQEGFLLDLPEAPQALQVRLAWTGGGKMMIMLHSHKEHGTNEYVEHITELDDANPKCLRVPTEDLVAGKWQVMVHSDDVRNGDFTLTVESYGAPASVVTDEYHGHWLQDGSFEVDEHPILPCVDA